MPRCKICQQGNSMGNGGLKCKCYELIDAIETAMKDIEEAQQGRFSYEEICSDIYEMFAYELKQITRGRE